MHEIFVNYRTKGGKDIAFQCHRLLSARFGHDSVFIARESIDPGTKYADVLIRTTRRSHVLLAVIDEGWIHAPSPTRPGTRALDEPQDWVRREIEECLTAGALVVPLFIGRKVDHLDPRRLPRSISELAECQYVRVDPGRLEEDLARLGDRLVARVPALAALDGAAATGGPEPVDGGTTAHNKGQSGGIGQVGGSVETYVNDTHAPLHTGHGDQHNGPRIEGDGTNYVAGNNHGGIRQGFGTRVPRGGRR